MFEVIFDHRTPDWCPDPTYNDFFLNGMQNYLNNLLVSRGHVFLNEVYDRLGLRRTQEGQLFGWVRGGGPIIFIQSGEPNTPTINFENIRFILDRI